MRSVLYHAAGVFRASTDRPVNRALFFFSVLSSESFYLFSRLFFRGVEYHEFKCELSRPDGGFVSRCVSGEKNQSHQINLMRTRPKWCLIDRKRKRLEVLTHTQKDHPRGSQRSPRNCQPLSLSFSRRRFRESFGKRRWKRSRLNRR